MFSPNSGSLNSLAPAAEDGEADWVGDDATAGCASAWGGAADFGAGVFSTGTFAGAFGSAGLAFAPTPFSTVKMTCPTLIFWPSLTRISFTVPVTEDGTSTTALSVSSSITGWPSITLAPGEIIRRTSSPWSLFSPSSGNLNSVTEYSLPISSNVAPASRPPPVLRAQGQANPSG